MSKTIHFVYLILFLFPIVNQGQNITLTDYLWKYVGDPVFTDEVPSDLSLTISPSGEPWIAFHKHSGGKVEIKRFRENTWENVGIDTLSLPPASDVNLSCNSAGVLHLSFTDIHWKACVMRFSGETWEVLGEVGFSIGTAHYLTLSYNSSGEPYVVYQDGSAGHNLTVQKFNGSTWEFVGFPGFTSNSATKPRIAIGPGNEPYVAYIEPGIHIDKLVVMKFTDSTWINTDMPLTEFRGQDLDLGVGPSGKLFIAFNDYTLEMINILEYSDNQWFEIIPPLNDYPTFFSFLVNTSGEPCVAFSDPKNELKATVLTYSGTEWLEIGDRGFTIWPVLDIQLANNISDQLYIAFRDNELDYQLSIMKYDSVGIGIHEQHNPKLCIFPNPATKVLNIIQDNSPDQIRSIEIYNSRGIKCFEKQMFTSSSCVDIEPLPNGLYSLKIYTKKTSYFAKFCKIND